jgi:lipopolysaccharide transport system ATP-binding protein
VSTRIELRAVSKMYPAPSGHRPSLGGLLLRRTNGAHRAEPRAAVDRVSLVVAEGERIGIVGRNGAGKSTLLKLIAGLMPPTAGELRVRGRVNAILSIGVGLREDLSGRENIYVDGELQGLSRAAVAQTMESVVAFADLGEFIDYPVRTYSTGMKARLAFAMATHVEPEVLLVDEALGVGDAAFAVRASARLKDLCDRGKIVVLVSHGMQTVTELCTRCLWLEEGRLVMDGDPAEVTQTYLDWVRGRDEAAVLGRFRTLAGARSFRTGCEISRLEVVPDGTETPRVILEAGEDVEVQVELELQAPVRVPDLRLRIVRLDGLLVGDARLRETAGDLAPAGSGRARYGIALRPLVLAPAVYRLSIELLAGEVVVAQRSTVVEVVARDVPVGGRPALLFPCALAARAITG